MSVDFKMISGADVEKGIAAGFKVMAEVGMDIHNERALSLLKEAGCEVDGVRVRIPRCIVEKAIKTAPSIVDVYTREGELAMSLGKRNTYFGPGPTCPNFLDPITGERRLAKKSDAADTAKAVDALTNIDFAMSLCVIGDETKTLADVHEIHAMVQNTVKPLVSWSFSEENLQDMIDMCAVVAGSKEELRKKPFLVVYCEPTTPLTHTKEALDKMMLLNENGVPCIYTPGMIMGGTAPITIAGALSVGLADSLTGLVISQLVVPGAPMICGAAGGPMDMKT
ncbi:MAG: trimethylamine methyltransferase family protein, partial [Clostridiales bacterium]